MKGMIFNEFLYYVEQIYSYDMGGKVTVHSEKGRGSTFGFTWLKHSRYAIIYNKCKK